ncbi:MAG: hypothetical protein K2L63_03095, partial [Paramuribaculum sp.]|nr:hypothetical protein [Paramuribaculum sp.]
RYSARTALLSLAFIENFSGFHQQDKQNAPCLIRMSPQRYNFFFINIARKLISLTQRFLYSMRKDGERLEI